MMCLYPLHIKKELNGLRHLTVVFIIDSSELRITLSMFIPKCRCLLVRSVSPLHNLGMPVIHRAY